MMNLAWPRTPNVRWYDNYIVALSALFVVVVAIVFMALTGHHDRSDATAGDAVLRPPGHVQPAAHKALTD